MKGWPNGTTVQVQRPTTSTDRRGNEQVDGWTTVETIDGAAFAPSGMVALTDQGRTGQLDQPRLFIRSQGHDIRPDDRIIIHGEPWMVEGNREDWTFIWSGRERTAVKLRKVEG